MPLDKELKERMGDMTQIEFAEEIGIAQSTLSEILSGKRLPGLSLAAAAIVRRYPELAGFFVPEDITIALVNRTSEDGK